MSVELLEDGGFEDDSPLWVWANFRSQRVNPFPPLPAHSPVWCAQLECSRWMSDGKVSQLSIPVPANSTVQLSFAISLKNDTGVDEHSITVTIIDGAQRHVAFTKTVAEYQAEYGVKWVEIETDPQAVSSGTVGVEFAGSDEGAGVASTFWLIDTASLMLLPPTAAVGAMMKSKAEAYKRFIKLLKTISGPPVFHWDLGGRVYNRLVAPEEMDGLVLPYLCVPLFEEGQQYPFFDKLTRTHWTQNLFGFTPDVLAHDRVNSDGAVNISKLHDDIVTAILGDMKLGGLLNGPVQLIRTDSLSGVDDSTYAELEMEWQMAMNFSRADLGPE